MRVYRCLVHESNTRSETIPLGRPLYPYKDMNWCKIWSLGYLCKFYKHEILEFLQVVLVRLVEFVIIVYHGDELRVLLVSLLLQRVVPVLCLDQVALNEGRIRTPVEHLTHVLANGTSIRAFRKAEDSLMLPTTFFSKSFETLPVRLTQSKWDSSSAAMGRFELKLGETGLLGWIQLHGSLLEAL